jgi:hypothetical protein
MMYKVAVYMLDASGLTTSTGPGEAGDGDLLLNVFWILDSERCFRNLRDPLSGVLIFSSGFFSTFGAGVESALEGPGRNLDSVGIVNQIECSVISILTSNYELYCTLGGVICYYVVCSSLPPSSIQSADDRSAPICCLDMIFRICMQVYLSHLNRPILLVI